MLLDVTYCLSIVINSPADLINSFPFLAKPESRVVIREQRYKLTIVIAHKRSECSFISLWGKENLEEHAIAEV